MLSKRYSETRHPTKVVQLKSQFLANTFLCQDRPHTEVESKFQGKDILEKFQTIAILQSVSKVSNSAKPQSTLKAPGSPGVKQSVGRNA